LTAALLLEEVIDAHGGAGRWQTVSELSVGVSAGGLAVASKFQRRGLRNLVARVSTDVQRVVFAPYPSAGHSGVFDRGAVRIQADDGSLVRQRLDPRTELGSRRHLLWWDHLDLLYFGGSALWTYMTSPFVFASPGFQVQSLDPWPERGEIWRRLEVTFPAELHTHSQKQVFYFGPDGLIRRQDYTAEEFGTWARSAHYSYGHRNFGGLVMPTLRRVFLRRADNRSRRHPILIWIVVRDVSIYRQGEGRSC
jgi:hypothetical protein